MEEVTLLLSIFKKGLVNQLSTIVQNSPCPINMNHRYHPNRTITFWYSTKKGIFFSLQAKEFQRNLLATKWCFCEPLQSLSILHFPQLLGNTVIKLLCAWETSDFITYMTAIFPATVPTTAIPSLLLPHPQPEPFPLGLLKMRGEPCHLRYLGFNGIWTAAIFIWKRVIEVSVWFSLSYCFHL